MHRPLPSREAPALTSPADASSADAWLAEVLEPLLRGISHALSNRATAFDGLASEIDEGTSPELSAEVQAEVSRLVVLNGDLRALLPDGGGEEPLDLRDVAQAAAALAAHWPAAHRTVATVDGDAPAVRTTRWLAVRIVVSMLVHAARAGHEVRVSLAGDADDAVLRVSAPAPARDGASPAAAEPSWNAWAAAQARAIGGTLAWTADGAELRLPTLRALRARRQAT